MIHPDKLSKSLWDLFLFLVSLGVTLLLPIELFFNIFGSEIVFYAGLAIPALFLIDIVLSLFIGYTRAGEVVRNVPATVRHYLNSYFVLDLLAALPIFFLVREGILPGTEMFFILSLNPLLKMIKTTNTLRKAGQYVINPAVMRLFLLVFWVLLAAHLISCGWMLVRESLILLPPREAYIEAFYWTITTLTTIGYGDITPQSTNQIVFVIVIELFGAAMYGLIIGNIASLIANIDVAKSQYQEKLDKVNAFMKYRGIPSELNKKINNYYQYLWESRRGYNEIMVLDDLPMALKESVALNLNHDIITKVPLFEKADDSLLRDIILGLEPVVYTPGDYIVRTGEIGTDMFFISRGSVEVLSGDEKTVYATLNAGQFFGEISLLLSMPRTATIRSLEFCDLYRLDKTTFDRIIGRYPNFQQSIRELADQRKREVEALRADSREEPREETVPRDGQFAPDIKAVGNPSAVTLVWKGFADAEFYQIAKWNETARQWRLKADNLPRPVWSDTQPEAVNRYRLRGIAKNTPGSWSNPMVVRFPKPE